MERIRASELGHWDRRYLKQEINRVRRAQGVADKRNGPVFWFELDEDARPSHVPPLIEIPRSGEFPPYVGGILASALST